MRAAMQLPTAPLKSEATCRIVMRIGVRQPGCLPTQIVSGRSALRTSATHCSVL